MRLLNKLDEDEDGLMEREVEQANFERNESSNKLASQTIVPTPRVEAWKLFEERFCFISSFKLVDGKGKIIPRVGESASK